MMSVALEGAVLNMENERNDVIVMLYGYIGLGLKETIL